MINKETIMTDYRDEKQNDKGQCLGYYVEKILGY